MIAKKSLKFGIVKAIFGCFFAILGLIFPLFANNAAYAEPNVTEPTRSVIENRTEENTDTPNDTTETTNTDETATENTTTTTKGKKCDDSLGSLGWLVCPTTGKIAEAVDWLYDKNKELLEINPVVADDSSPIYQVWTYCLGVANIAFVIFLLIAVYSQITGLGISNYGLKKVLPKLIVAAILVNLSFYICSLAVDVSNVIGAGLRGVFTAVEESTVPAMFEENSMDTLQAKFAMADMYRGIGEGTLAAGTGAIIAFESGEIWMLIPAVLGALVAVVTGLITIALRQVVVVLLIMIAPIAIVAYILPNTEQWFKKWKDLLFRMMIFYPMYSLLFGASSLAGWAIIASSTSGFTTILGVAVKIFPLFFSWSLMKMSGTFLGTINAKLNGVFTAPLATNRAWADSHRTLTKQKYLASGQAFTPSLKLRQFIENRRVAREEEIKEYQQHNTQRGITYGVEMHRNKDGSPSKDGVRAYEIQARNLRYKYVQDRDKNNYNKGLGQLEATKRSRDFELRKKLDELDFENMRNADMISAEEARGEKINYDNAKSREQRFQKAMDAHMDDLNAYIIRRDENGNIVRVPRAEYRPHFEKGSSAYNDAISHYSTLSSIMEGSAQNTQYAVANAIHAYDTQKKILETKMQKLFENTVPTQDVMNRLNELTRNSMAIANIDAIVAGMRVLNQRGDTDLVKSQLDQILDIGVELGTHASQSLASFLMFEVKDNDPFLRRFGKYLNLETARAFNENAGNPADMRKKMLVDYDEYIKGYHIEPNGERMYAKKDMTKLVEGTSLDNIERTAFSNLDESLKKAYGYDPNNKNKAWDVEGYFRRREALQTAMEPAFLSASLKWLSGSEQINSAVKFWTGYEVKQDKNEDGTLKIDENGDPIYTLKTVYGDFGDYEDYAHDYFQRKTIDMVKDQTTAQILGMRTDYRDPIIEHLITERLKGNPNLKEKYDTDIQDIESQYAGESDEARTTRKKKIDMYKREFARVQMMDILGRTGKLETIFNAKRSGATANAKDWLRSLVGLDDIDNMGKEVERWKEIRNPKKPQEQQQPQDQQGQGAGDSPMFSSSVYNADDVRAMQNEVENEYHNRVDDEGFYKTSIGLLRKYFGQGSFFEWLYEKYREANPYADASDLADKLYTILGDPDNYR